MTKTPKLAIQISTLPMYSQVLMSKGVSPIFKINVSGFERDSVADLTVSVVGKCKEKEFLHRHDYVIRNFCPEMYNYKQNNSCVFELDFGDFEIDRIFLSSVFDVTDADLYVMVTYGKELATQKKTIKLLPSNMWQGLDFYPETLAAFAQSTDECVADLCKDIPKISYTDCVNKPQALTDAVKAVYTALKQRNIIYTRPVGYSADSAQVLKSQSELFTSPSALATPLELALAFCACAEHCGFCTTLLFVRSKMGELGVLCGLWTRSTPSKTAVCDDIDFICTSVKYGELIFTEPGVFAAAQNTSFSLAVENTVQSLLSSPNEIVCMIDMTLAEKSKKTAAKGDAQQGFSDIYANLSESPEIKMLSGFQQGRYPEIPLLVTNFDEFFANLSSKHRLYPLDVNVSIGDFAGVDSNFSSSVTCAGKPKDRLSSNDAVKKQRLEALKNKLQTLSGVSSALKEEKMCEIASHMTFAKDSCENYVTLGYIKILDKLTKYTVFVPMSFAPVNMTKQGAVYYFSAVGTPFVNKVFVKNALTEANIPLESFMNSEMPKDNKGIFELFSEVCHKLGESHDRYSYSLVKEAHIIRIDFSDYRLWQDMSAFRAKITQSKALKSMFEEQESKASSKQENFPVNTLVSDIESMCAVTNTQNRLVQGCFTHKKLEVLSALAKKNVTEGKTILITTPDDNSASYTAEFLKADGLQDGVLLFDAKTDAHSLSRSVTRLLDKYKDAEYMSLAQMPNDLFLAANALAQYEAAYNKKHKIGVSLNKVQNSYLEASSPSDSEELYVDEAVFKSSQDNVLESLFADATSLVYEARKLCNVSGIEEYTPINTHPLYGTKPDKLLDEKDEQRTRALSANIQGVISEYRDTFLDVSPVMGLELDHIKSLKALRALNGLYKLALSARDVDVPEIFHKSDIEHFSTSVKAVSTINDRCKQIRDELSFFEKEIFEDIENLLSGSRNDEEEKGFLKKFLHRKNDEDKLLQYVESSKTSALKSRNLDETYALLYEYKSLVKQLRGYNTSSFGFSRELAEIAIKAGDFLDDITLDNRNVLLSKFFKLVTVIPVDPELAREITVARAHLSEVFKDGEFCLAELGKLLGADFENMTFESGILSFDGISRFISGAVGNLDVTQNWLQLLDVFERVQKRLPSFVEYIKTQGADGNVDRLFARSLLLPALRCVKNDVLGQDTVTKIFSAKENYVSLMIRASELCKSNFDATYSQSLSHLATTTRKEGLEVKSNISAREYFKKHRGIISKTLPCVVISKSRLSDLLSEECTFDVSAVLDTEKNGYGGLPALCFGKSFVLFNMSSVVCSDMFEKLRENTPCFDTDKIVTGANARLFSYLCAKGTLKDSVLAKTDSQSSAEVIRVNGTYDKRLRINKAQAEHAVIKACELLNQYRDKVAVCAFTEEMSEYCHKNAYAMRKNNKLLDKALEYNMIEFCTPENLNMSGCVAAVVCGTVCPDKLYNRAYDYSLAHSKDNSSLSDAYVSVCSGNFRKVYFVTGLSNVEERYTRCVNSSYLEMCDFADYLESTKLPVVLCDKRDYNSVVPVLLAACGNESGFVQSTGVLTSGAGLVSREKTNDKLYIFADLDKGVCMHDGLLSKYYAAQNADTMTLPVTMISDMGIRELAKDLRKRING